MKIIVSNNIRVQDPDDVIKNYAEQTLVIPNPDYLRNERLGYSNYKTPLNLVFYEINGNELILPFGCLRDLFDIYPSNMFENRIILGEKLKYKSNISLFEYQEEVCKKALVKKNGIIVMPARFRKNTNSIRNYFKTRFKNIMDNTHNRFVKSKL